jgi:mutator protein MutT
MNPQRPDPEPADSQAGRTLVGIGIIARGGSVLIRQRPEGTVYAGYWEFPGGKCEPGESPEEATVRECLEEIGIDVRLIRLRKIVEHTYPHGAVRLHFFDGETVLADAQPTPGTGFRWVHVAQLSSLRFPEANDAILAELLDESAGDGIGR